MASPISIPFSSKLLNYVYVLFLIAAIFQFINNGSNNKGGAVSTSTDLKFEYKVSKVVDGDTLHIEYLDGRDFENGKKYQVVRLIGINTPETVDPRRPVECFGKEASNYSKSISDGMRAALEIDPTQSKFDKYGRLLGYLYVESSGITGSNYFMLNQKMIEEGYAYEYTYEYPYKYQEYFKKLEKIAKDNQAGLWDPKTCDGLKTPISSPPNL